ncbi:PilZ domain-containing protein [Cyanobium sp. Cruz CV13-4-11]|uniref:PilZ domain-containing protein n=1 Tax=unclassified Cyanobium TaxID=2627006 RepID=UPI0020CC0947|nr:MULTISPECIES: PilZ domain-containing protein [unclassified Cyanobium]MCP9901993.1 PilZ domain-containing protein [Cyanobium sp. Cruz CV11-17]MCP9920680.1 PilZ domain-containing protein [Cyanobium sp. Cruz CV13-4-11]
MDRKESTLPAREPRFSAPFFQILIRVELFIRDNCYLGHLRDGSRSGACIRSFQPVPTGSPAQIRFHDPSDEEIIETRVELVWMNQLRGAHYSGLRFEEGFDITKTFLRLLLKAEES